MFMSMVQGEPTGCKDNDDVLRAGIYKRLMHRAM